MTFKKILLATAITAVSSSAFALEAMDEASLSATTGQDGLTVTITNSDLAALDLIIHDKGGFTGRAFDGAIVIDNIDVGALNLTLDIDAGSDAVDGTNNNTLQIKAYNTTSLAVDMGTLQVANSGRDNAGGWGIQGTPKDVLDLGSLTIGATTSAAPLLNIQMGNEQQGNWMRLNPSFTGGLVITGMKLFDGTDATPTYGIGIDTLTLLNATGTTTNLDASINVDATASGLVLGIATLGTGGMNVRMAGVRLGDVVAATPATAIGDVEIVGLNLNGTSIAVIGH